MSKSNLGNFIRILGDINLIKGLRSFLRSFWGKLILSFLLILILLKFLYYFLGLDVISIIVPYQAVDSIIKSCSPFISVEQCPNGDWVVGRNSIHVDGSISVFNKYGFLLYTSEGWVGTRETLIGKLRTILGKESGCSENESINICQTRKIR
jgi:hypothetical protein